MAHAALLALPGAVLAGVVALGAAAARPPARPGGGRVELEVAGVLPMHEGGASILVLREKGARTLLPLVVPGGEDGRAAPHGGGLLGQAIEALGGRVSEVEIERAEETRTGARVRLAQGSRRVEVRARPSEALPLALSAGVPIVTSRRVLDQAGLTPEDLARAHGKGRRDLRL
jgi:bifunctional DNase/RNase